MELRIFSIGPSLRINALQISLLESWLFFRGRYSLVLLTVSALLSVLT